MIVTGHLIGQRQVRGIENAGLGAKKLEEPCRLLDGQAREGTVPQRAVKQQNARCRLVVTKPARRTPDRESRIESWANSIEVKDGRERQLNDGENHRRKYAITAVCIPHSHSIVPGGFDV